MNFEITDYRTIPDSDCIEDVIAVARKTGKRTVTHEEYGKHGKYNYNTLRRKFGPWHKVLKRAGLEIPRWHFQWQWETEEEKERDLFENIANVWRKLGRQPKYKEMIYPLSLYTSALYARQFGTWLQALRLFSAYKNNEYHITGKPVVDSVDEKTGKACPAKRDTRHIPLRLKFNVFARDNYRCKCCGKSPATHLGLVLHCDHIIPWSKGGRTTMENLQTLCSECNIGKGDRIME